MSEANSTARRKPNKATKPSKPYPEFPLTAHPAGVWCKKIRGRLHYFGTWADPDGALQLYNQQREAQHEGRKPHEIDDATLTVKRLCNRFLNNKQASLNAGELSPRTLTDYEQACNEMIKAFGKGRLVDDLGPDDFAALRETLAKKWGSVRVGNTIQRIRCVFKFGVDEGRITRLVIYGQSFKRPSNKALRLIRLAKGPQMFTAKDIRDMLDTAGIQLRAMILLGINCGFGNSDCGTLPCSAVDLDAGLIDYPRAKTGIQRRCALWPETVEAIRAVLAKRGDIDGEASGLVFVTKYGKSWAKDVADSPITKETKKVLNKLKINSRRNFYTLRHTFRTVADESLDQPAVDLVMGHESSNMSNHYREAIRNERLKAVAEKVRAWLWPKVDKRSKARTRVR